MESKVTIFDPKAEPAFTEIPESELAPGMMQVQVDGREGIVWVEPAKLHQSELRHPPFTGEIRDAIAKIQSSFPDVYDKSYKFWEDGFRRDANPESEINHWQFLAKVYSNFAGNHTLNYRNELFNLILACSGSERDKLKFVFEPTVIPSREFSQIVSTFYE